VDQDKVTDLAGNVLPGTTTVGQHFTIDRTKPYPTFIGPADANPTSAASVRIKIVFNEPVTGVTAASFSVSGSGAVGAGISGPAASESGATEDSTWYVPMVTGDGDGTMGLNLTNSTGIFDLAGNPYDSTWLPYVGDKYTIYKSNPSTLSIRRADPNPTRATTLSWTATFSRDVTGVDADNFSLVKNGVTGGTITVTPVSQSVYTVTAIDLSGTGTVELDLSANQTRIKDLAGNQLINTTTAGEVYTIDTVPPTVTITRSSPTTPTKAQSVTWSVTFSEAVTGVATGNFSLPVTAGTISGAHITGLSGASPGAAYTITADTGSGNATLGLDLSALWPNIKDLAGNPLDSTTVVGQTFLIDKTPPSGGSVTITPVQEWQLSRVINLQLVPGTDTGGSGLAAAGPVLQRSFATLSNGSCGTFGGPVTVANPGAATTYADNLSTVNGGNPTGCWKYFYVQVDNAGNVTNYVSAIQKLDYTDPSGGTISVSPTGPFNSSSTGITITTYGGPPGSAGLNANGLLQRSSTPLTNGTCGTTYGNVTFVAAPGIAANTTTSDTFPQGVELCYQYIWTVFSPSGRQTPYTSVPVKVDTTAPGGGSINYTGGSYTSTTTSVRVDFTNGSDGNGPLTRQLARFRSQIVDGACNWGAAQLNGVLTAPESSPVFDPSTTGFPAFVSGYCYAYRYVVTDAYGNVKVYTTAPGSVENFDAETTIRFGDPSAPTIAITTPASDNVILSSSGTTYAGESAWDDAHAFRGTTSAGVTSVTATVQNSAGLYCQANGGGCNQTAPQPLNITGTTSWDVGSTFQRANIPAGGGYLLTVKAVGPTGVTGVATRTYNIDYDPAQTVFVSSSGNDGNSGYSPSAPKQSITAAMSTAASNGRTRIALAGGTPFGSFSVSASNLTFTGGYDLPTVNASGKRSAPGTNTTTISGAGTGLLVDGRQGIALQQLTIAATNGGLSAGASTYGVRAINGATVSVARSVVTAAPGMAGATNGTPPGAGANGTNGGSGTGGCDHCGSTGGGGGSTVTAGGAGGNNPGRSGGNGGGVGSAGACGGSGGGLGYYGGNKGTGGCGGAAGAQGGAGQGGVTPAGAYGATFTNAAGANGGTGGNGASGGGGGAGGGGCDGTFCVGDWLSGGAGGGGGGGGGGGRGGFGGGGGGGSFAVYAAASSTVTIDANTTLSTGAGGRGGDGGAGQLGGSGGSSGSGGNGNCTGGCANGGGGGASAVSGGAPGSAGPNGNNGGDGSGCCNGTGGGGGSGGGGGGGGRGGTAGGGAGGSSIAMLSASGSSISFAGNTSTQVTLGASGAGGSGGNSGGGGLSQASASF
jgi:hypothetical protein